MRTIRAIIIIGAMCLLPLGCDDGTGPGETGDPQPQPAATEGAAADPAPENAPTPSTAEAAEAAEAAPAVIPELEVQAVATLLEAGDCVAIDANNARTRASYGSIPGATLLTSSGRYDPATELPDDTSAKLVFYCSNDDCRASDGAAGRAQAAGYSDVNVMRAGIAGWAEAGRDTAPAS